MEQHINVRSAIIVVCSVREEAEEGEGKKRKRVPNGEVGVFRN